MKIYQLVLALFSFASLKGQSAYDKIDSIVLDQYKNDSLNGCILILKNDKEIYKSCYGYSNFEIKTPLNDSTLFFLASLSKQFTAYCILQLKEANKLKLSDPVKKYLPQFPYPSINIEHLLDHTSGLADYMELLYQHWDRKKQIAHDTDVLNSFYTYKPALKFQPGSQFEYSNSGYVILACIIEKISGMSYDNYLNSYIFKPLHMQHSRVINMPSDHLLNFAIGYKYSKKENKYVQSDTLKDNEAFNYLIGINGDKSIGSTITDLEKWSMELNHPTLIKDVDLNSAWTRKKTTDGKKIDYGYGFFIIEDKDLGTMIYHAGGWPGYVHQTIRLNGKIVIITITNNESKKQFTLAKKISAILNDYSK